MFSQEFLHGKPVKHITKTLDDLFTKAKKSFQEGSRLKRVWLVE